MTAAWLWARSRVRHRWRTLLVLAIVTGLGAGVAMTAAAGSKRASTAWQRFRASTASPNLFFTPPPDDELELHLEEVRRLPGVLAVGALVYTPVSPANVPVEADVGAFMPVGRGLLETVYRPRILEGRAVDPDHDDEVTVNRELAALARVHAGDRITVRMGYAPPFKRAQVSVVGIHVAQFDLGGNGAQPNMLVGRGFAERHADDLVTGGRPAVTVRLADGDAGVRDFQRRLLSVYPRGAVVVSAQQDEAAVVDAVSVQKVGLGLLALVAGLATLVAAVQTVGRLFRAERADMVILSSLGMRRRHLAIAGASVVAAAGVLAAGIAVATATFGSSFVPSGQAGRMELPGLRLEPVILMVGGLIVPLLLGAAGGLLVLRIVTQKPKSPRAQPVAAAGPLPMRLGAHWTFAKDAPGAATGSARAALTAVVAGAAGIAAVVTFAASLSHLVATQRLFGWDFDGGFQSQDLDQAGLEEALPKLASDRRLEALAFGTITDVPINGSTIEVFAFDQRNGVLHPSVIEGRAPVGSDEINLGTESLSRVGAHIGGQVRVGESGVPFRVVGRAVYPELGNNSDLANAASITANGLERLGKEAEPVGAFALVKVKKGVAIDAVLETHDRSDDNPIDNSAWFVPPRVLNIDAVGSLPWLLAGFLGALALTALAHALALSVRARRRELAVLRALGAVRSQVASAVWSQATLTVLAGSIVGVPIGIAVGRQGWGLVADGLGVVNSPVIAWAVLAGITAVAFLIANLVATGPALIASRLHPASVLRSE